MTASKATTAASLSPNTARPPARPFRVKIRRGNWGRHGRSPPESKSTELTSDHPARHELAKQIKGLGQDNNRPRLSTVSLFHPTFRVPVAMRVAAVHSGVVVRAD